MRLFRAALLLGVAALPTLAGAQSAPPQTATGARTESVKPIDFSTRTLPNGLRVYAIRDTTTPNVSVQVWYDVGSKDDPKGRSGFAHMFEHLMFKATRNLVPEQMDRLTEDVGGYNNASTADDYTNYYEVVPANHLQRLLFAEADRMAALVVEPKSFASERDVVKEELRQRTLAQPYGKLFSIYYPKLAYSVHPYARPGIGSLEELESAGIDDVRAFHATYYRPDNAVLVVSGNFDPAQLDRWVDEYFANIKRPSAPIPRVTVQEPARTAAVSRTVYEANTPLPAVLISYHVPPERSADTPALMVLNAILSAGESSRLYESLVYRDQLAQSASTFLDTKQSTGNFVAYAMLASGKTAAEGEAALKREIARVRDTAVSPAELAEAKNELLTSALKQRETAEGKASLIANSVIVNGDPTAADRQIAAIQTVTAADVQRVAREYLKDQQSATIRYLPAEGKPAGTTDTPIAIAPTVQVAALTPPANIAVVTPAPEGQRILPPAPGAPIAPTLPQPVVATLSNGIRVVTVERHDLPLVTASLVALGGSATDPAGKAGASSLAADLMTKGTQTRSATEIARAVESLGGSIESSASDDGASIDLTVPSAQVDTAMTILADVATRPTFAPAEIERARSQTIDGLNVAMKNPAQLSGMVADRVVYGTRAYGQVSTPTSLKGLTRADLTAAYARSWKPGQATLLLVGDVTPAQARLLAEKHLGQWRAAGAATAATSAEPAFPAPRVIVVDMPDAGQAGVVVARPGIRRADERYYPLAVANTVLGGGFSSRLNQEIRIKRGLAYGAGSSVLAGRDVGLISARTQTKNPSAAEVVGLIDAEMRRLGTAPVAPAELETRQAVLIGNFGRTIETTDGVASILAGYTLQGVPLDELSRYIPRVQAVDPAAVQTNAAALLDPKAASVIVVGDAKQFLPALRQAHPEVEVIPAGQINLDSPKLR
ncbi:M16 family metallopeptidase [Sphingomonas pseudosanguinis]|uniref:Zinc protease n=1 Tax=Sphingomonas pseudosanguinis TaxID=413712 RepID=A0A7W6ACM6_9SPHN|nr:pitrilysin family protein [Sphingomonas pseudosanguinis]MBB3878246.1 zinc protease [Sphingomonas pseudosanguinis]MBN3538115.1 insulinase family protein [Sphingomonas pseudosanguinis]